MSDHQHQGPSWHPETIAVSAGRPPHVPGAPVNYPIGVSSTFHAGGDFGYIREGTVGTIALESVIGQMEGGTSIAYGSGMATVNAVADLVPAGGVVVAPNHAYPGTLGRLRELAAVGRLQLREVQIDDTAAVLEASRNADLIWLETPTNPLMEVADIRAAVAAKAAGCIVVVDNTFMSPVRQRPLELGADISMHSGTKSIAGHSDALIGLLTAADPEVADKLRKIRALQGGFPGSLETFLALRGVRTLHLRMERAEANAMEIARRLAAHSKVDSVLYAGLESHPGHALHFSQATGAGAVVSVVIKGDAAAADRVCETAQLWTYATSLGGVESTMERRRRWPAEPAATPESLIRLSVGIEHVEDLWADLVQAIG